MTTNPVWVLESSPLSEAATLMVMRDLKRLPVLNDQGQLVGMVSRGDLLGTVAGNRPAQEQVPMLPQAQAQHVADIMLREVATVGPTSSLPEVLDALMQTHQRRVVVVDGERRVLGIISDGDVLRRAARHVPASSARGLWGWLRGGPQPASFELAGSQLRAQEIMTSPVHTIAADTPIRQAVEKLLSLKVKRLPVVDGQGHLLGLVGRAGLLQALTRDSERSM